MCPLKQRGVMLDGACAAWRLVVFEDAVKRARRLGVYERFVDLVMDLDRRLRGEPEAIIEALRGEPVVGRVAGYAARRLRMGKYRVFYYLDYERRLVVVFWIEHRKRAYGRR